MRRGDTLLVISQRGQVESTARALQTARRGGATTIAMVGYDGGRLRDLADICLLMQSAVAEQVEDVQTMLVHMLCVALRQRLSRAPGPAPSIAAPVR